MGEEISEVEKLDQALARLQDRIRTTLPAIVTKYNKVTNRAEVKLVRRNKNVDGSTFGPSEFPDLPVYFPRGGGISIRWELSPGDEVILCVCDRSIAEWLTTGKVSDPTWSWQHNISDAFLLPGVSSIANPLPGGDGRLYIGRDDGAATIKLNLKGAGVVEVEAPSIKLGVAAVLAIARETDPLTGSAAAAAWALVVEGAINALAPGTFTGANSWLSTVAPPGGLGTITSGATKAKAE